MKLRIILFSFFLLPTTILTAQCTYLSDQFGATNAPIQAGTQQVLATCIFAGEYIRINNMEEGLEYRFETCGDIDFNTEMTLFNAGGGASLAYNDDFCSTQSEVIYTPTTDGSFDLQINQAPGCLTNTTCMTTKMMLLTSCRMECPADITVQTTNAGGIAVNYVVNELPTTNTCVPVSNDSNEDSGDVFPVGVHLVELTDATGGTVTCNFNVTVELVLPVEYTYFHGTPTKDGNLLEWATASETNNSHFVIQRSTDAWTWEDIKKVNGQGDSNIETNYRFLDQQLPIAKEIYYRIQQVDFDGAFNYTDIIALSGASAKPQLDVFPNPARSRFTLSMEGFVLDEAIQISLLNITNQTLLNKTVDSNGNYEIEIPESTPPGIYILKAISSEHKIVKQIIIY